MFSFFRAAWNAGSLAMRKLSLCLSVKRVYCPLTKRTKSCIDFYDTV